MKKREIYSLIVILCLIIISFVCMFLSKNNSINECIKVQTTCCSCEMGGKETCVFKSEELKYKNNLKNCSKDIFCHAMYNCQIEKCKYEFGKCHEVILKNEKE